MSVDCLILDMIVRGSNAYGWINNKLPSEYPVKAHKDNSKNQRTGEVTINHTIPLAYLSYYYSGSGFI